MDFSSLTKQSINALMANKLRSAFSILGIVVGVMAVVFILSLGEGLKGMVMNEIEALGPNILGIAVKVPGVGQMGTLQSMATGIKITTLNLKDIKDLENKNRFPYIEGVTGQAFGQEWASYGAEEKKILIYGCSADFISIMKIIKVDSGRFFTGKEDDNLTKAVVLGSGLKEELFGNTDPMGKKVKFKGLNFKVIGVLRPYNGFPSVGGMDMNDFAYIPLQTAFKEVLGIDYVSEIDVALTDASYTSQAIAEISRLLRRNHGITDPEKDDFQIMTMEEVLNMVNDMAVILNLLLGFLAAISLLVGGVGIMNIMLVSVNERTKEIGLRKALGASKSDILRQFLLESLVVTGLGGAIGAFLGVTGSLATGFAIRSQFIPSWPITISWLAIFVAFSISAVIGLAFGIQPARKAAELDPIKAMRDE